MNGQVAETPTAPQAAVADPGLAVAAQNIEDRRNRDVIANKQLRVALDDDLQVLKALPPSRERSLAITKLQEAIMWLGMDLKRLAEPNPYPNSYDPSNAIVDKTADGLKL